MKENPPKRVKSPVSFENEFMTKVGKTYVNTQDKAPADFPGTGGGSQSATPPGRKSAMKQKPSQTSNQEHTHGVFLGGSAGNGKD